MQPQRTLIKNLDRPPRALYRKAHSFNTSSLAPTSGLMPNRT